MHGTLTSVTPDWFPDWRGECVAIVASGPSTTKENVETLRDRIHVVAINESWRLAPWADALYGCDAPWWKLRGGVPEFRGLKISQDDAACAKYPDIRKVEVAKLEDRLLIDKPGILGAGGNSGFQAKNLVVQFGVTGIALIGFDMRGEHWHGRHPQPLTNPVESNFARWRRAFDGAAVKLRELGADVVNCSPDSTLKAYPKMTVDAALARWGL